MGRLRRSPSRAHCSRGSAGPPGRWAETPLTFPASTAASAIREGAALPTLHSAQPGPGPIAQTGPQAQGLGQAPGPRPQPHRPRPALPAGSAHLLLPPRPSPQTPPLRSLSAPPIELTPPFPPTDSPPPPPRSGGVRAGAPRAGANCPPGGPSLPSTKMAAGRRRVRRRGALRRRGEGGGSGSGGGGRQ